MTSFNRSEIVRQHKPDPTTTDGQQRIASLAGLIADLEVWAVNHHLTTTRLKESAYTGIVATPVPTPYNEALLLAKYILWTFNLDVYIDRFDYLRFDRANPGAWLEYFDCQLRQILQPIHVLGGMSTEQAVECGLNPLIASNCQIEEISLMLERVLRDLFESMAAWGNQAALSFSLNIFAWEIARMVGAMRGELIQNYGFLTDPLNQPLPTLEAYIAQSQYSIGLRPGGAIAASFEADPARAWANCNCAMFSAARAVRLANDIPSYTAEVEENKVTSVTIALAMCGFAPTASHAADSDALRQAQALIDKTIQQELAYFEEQLNNMFATELANWLKITLAFALAMYATGNYVPPQ